MLWNREHPSTMSCCETVIFFGSWPTFWIFLFEVARWHSPPYNDHQGGHLREAEVYLRELLKCLEGHLDDLEQGKLGRQPWKTGKLCLALGNVLVAREMWLPSQSFLYPCFGPQLRCSQLSHAPWTRRNRSSSSQTARPFHAN
jgi:hypothetical protein